MKIFGTFILTVVTLSKRLHKKKLPIAPQICFYLCQNLIFFITLLLLLLSITITIIYYTLYIEHCTIIHYTYLIFGILSVKKCRDHVQVQYKECNTK